MKKTICMAGVILLLSLGLGCKQQAVSSQPVAAKPTESKPAGNPPVPGKPVQADVSEIAPGDDAGGMQQATIYEPGSGDANEKAGKNELIGMQKLQGELYSEKYGQAMVAGIALPQDFICLPGTPDWKPEILAMKGKIVVLEGEVWRYHCKPSDQCDVSGHMDFVSQIKYLKLLE